MQFDVVGFIFNSLVLLFFTMTLGNLFGDIKFRKFNFGITGTLFIGLFVGYFLTKYAVTIPEGSKHISKAQNILKGNIIDNSIMNLSLLIFIVGTGLLAAKDMKYAITKFGKQFVIIAIFIPFVGAVFSYGFSQVLNNMSPYQITGTYTGALTSSAGLAAATESSEAESRQSATNFQDLNEKTKTKILAIINNAKERDAKLKNEAIPEKMTLENTTTLSAEDTEIYVTEAKAGVGVGHSIGLQSTLPVLENAEKNTVVTKTLIFPESGDGVKQTQTITYKGKQFLKLVIRQIRPLSEELKSFIADHGLEETQKALLEAEEKDEMLQEARKLAGFTLETKLLSETEIQTTTTYDLQVLDVKKASQTDYLKNLGLETLLKNEPSQYIADRVANGATEQ